MSATMITLLASLFLPLFPLSIGFNSLFARLRHPLVRTIMLLVWPQAGIAALSLLPTPIREWIPTAALATSILYGIRALALRELGLWTSFLATSSWSLLWIMEYHGAPARTIQLYALGFSVPLVLLAWLTASLERRFGAAYSGLYGGLAQMLPRLSGVLVLVVLAVMATPVFPAFFAMLSAIVASVPAAPSVAAGVAGSWLIWSWAGARLLQGMIVGPGRNGEVRDLSLGATWAYGLILVMLTVAGLSWIGGLR
jgi:NADH:ubiquinone oxidoreductase subunit 4 (subunit M)